MVFELLAEMRQEPVPLNAEYRERYHKYLKRAKWKKANQDTERGDDAP